MYVTTYLLIKEPCISVPRRIEAVLKEKAGCTKYWFDLRSLLLFMPLIWLINKNIDFYYFWKNSDFTAFFTSARNFCTVCHICSLHLLYIVLLSSSVLCFVLRGAALWLYFITSLAQCKAGYTQTKNHLVQQESVCLYCCLFSRSRSYVRLLSHGHDGKPTFNQRLQPMAATAHLCIPKDR